jgi:hypothetical protein
MKGTHGHLARELTDKGKEPLAHGIRSLIGKGKGENSRRRETLL